MSTLTKPLKISHKIASVWKLPTRLDKEKLYSSDDLINAYLEGKKDQRSYTERILFKQLKENFDLAKKIGSDFFNLLLNKHVKCKYVLLRAKNISEFDTYL